MRIRSLFVPLGIIVLGCVAAVAFGGRVEQRPSDTRPYLVVPTTSRSALDRAFGEGAALMRTPTGTPGAGILPHHLVASSLIAAFFSGIQQNPAPDTIVVIGPDHDNVGRGYITTSRANWSTPDGDVMADTALIDALIEAGSATIDDDLIKKEHSVYTPLPFIRRTFPNTKVVLLAVRGDHRPEKLDTLAAVLASRLGQHDLVIASVDFSHYKNASGAWQDDAATLPVIEKMDETAALSIPVDSPPSISFLLRYANKHSLTYQGLVHTNSAELLHDLTITSTTSYLTAYFYR